MAVTHSRDYYRSLPTSELVCLAREEGMNPEMAIAVIERLSENCTRGVTGMKRGFEFNQGGNAS